jgi:regulator of replication initiation timing
MNEQALRVELEEKDRYAKQLFNLCGEWAAKAGQSDKRVQELERKLEDQAATHARLMVDNADLRAKLDAVPVQAIRKVRNAAENDGYMNDDVDEWLGELESEASI